jgi:hypothetical protein
MISISHFSKLILSSLLIFLIPSCGSRRATIVSNAFLDTAAIPYGFTMQSSFSIAHANAKDSMLAKEVSQKIEAALEDKGYTIADKNHAAYQLNFSYDMKKDINVMQTAKYVPGQTFWKFGKDGYEQMQSSGTTVYTPEAITFFTKTLYMTVYSRDNAKDPIWQITVSSTDENSDLREIMDYLITAAFKQFGKNTKKNIKEVYKIK